MERFQFEQKAPGEHVEGIEIPEMLQRRWRNAELTVVGSSRETPEANQQAFGRYLAERIARAVEQARSERKKLVFDMATGSTPAAVWPELKKLVEAGNVDLRNIIIIGHEEAWGSYRAGSHSDFDAYRKRLLEDNGIDVQPITDPQKASAQTIEGNFVPMHLVTAKSEHRGEERGQALSDTEEDAARESAARYGTILKALEERGDVRFFGLYGVGTDGHVGEMQVSSLGRQKTRRQKASYNDPVEEYSIERGLFLWQTDKESGFHPENNIFWERGAQPGDPVGRAAWQDYTDIRQVVGIGWRDLLREDELILALNNESKALALELAIKGSLDGDILNERGERVRTVERVKGEGENIVPDLEHYVLRLEKEGTIPKGTVERLRGEGRPDSPEKLHVDAMLRAIYHAFDAQEVRADDPRFRELWTLINRYIGKRAHVARLIRLRSIVGKNTELVVTQEVLRDTPFRTLLQKD